MYLKEKALNMYNKQAIKKAARKAMPCAWWASPPSRRGSPPRRPAALGSMAPANSDRPSAQRHGTRAEAEAVCSVLGGVDQRRNIAHGGVDQRCFLLSPFFFLLMFIYAVFAELGMGHFFSTTRNWTGCWALFPAETRVPF